MELWKILETSITLVSALCVAITALISTMIAAMAIYQTVKLHEKQMLLEQRQFLLPLWTQLQELNEIDPRKPVWVDVIKAVNILELIAISWEGQLIDENLIRRMYSNLYIEMYENIMECGDSPDNISKNGKQMLIASPATSKLYNKIKRENLETDYLRPIN